MKHLFITLVVAFGVPAITLLAYFSRKARSWLFSTMVFALCLGDKANVNFAFVATYRGPDRGFEVTLADLIALALAASTALRYPHRIKIWPYNTGPMLLFFLYSSATVLWAPQPLFSAFTVFKLGRAYLFYWCVVNCLRTGISLRDLERALLLMAFYLTTLTLVQKYLYKIYRVPGTLDHPNAFANFLNLFMPLMLAIGLSIRPSTFGRSELSVLAAICMLFSCVMTFSRTAIVLGSASALGLLFFANVRLRSPRVALATLLALLCLTIGGSLVARRVLERFEEAPDASAMARDEFNYAARLMLEDHPGGVGINQFSYVLTTEKRYNQHITVMSDEKRKGVCHHIFWLTAAETGYPGLLLFLFIIARFLFRAFTCSWRGPSEQGLVQAAIFLATLGLHLAGLYEWVFRITPIFFGYLLLCGLSVGLQAPQTPHPAPARSPS